ncbi:MAG: hypothetical protein IJ560_02150 [Alphaproteobacteria bacterium]|nr:hypothetical protein [Alphaproteobacteria bacterium]
MCNFVPGVARRARIRREKLYDFRRKYDCLRRAFPEINWKRAKMIKGGWNIGFIVDKKYVFKIRKFNDRFAAVDKVLHEKRITDAMVKISPLKIPQIQILTIGEFTFYRYNFIPGRNLNTFSRAQIIAHRNVWARQIAEFIHTVHNARPHEVDDLITGDGDGWNHNDICNNLIVDVHTMRIVGLIDWEYAGWGKLDTEFKNCVMFSKNMRAANIIDDIKREYLSMG